MMVRLSVFGIAAAFVFVVGCPTAPTAFPVVGPGTDTGNESPTLTFLNPDENLTVAQGTPFLVSWTDSDRDNDARIRFTLIDITTNNRIILADDIGENDTTAPDSLVVPTSLLPTSAYNLLGTIDDNVNPPVDVYAVVAGAGTSPQRVVITIVGQGEGPQTQPPRIAVIEPSFNLSVSQDDVLSVVVQPTAFPPVANRPYDPDSTIAIFILLDLDLDPNNDNPALGTGNIIVLRQAQATAGQFEDIEFEIPIDLNEVPPLDSGDPYFIRATAVDPTNPPVHSYAVGNISVVRLASGLVDLFNIGRTQSGVRVYGFTPGANLGSTMAYVSDFDADGIDDFALVAQFGNPRNFGPVGEAYLIYGLDGVRFGGAIASNSISDTVSGVIFEAPPVREELRANDPRTDGITDVSWIPDLSGDGRPELIFGMSHVHGALETMDFDPGDQDVGGGEDTVEVEIVVRQGQVTVNEADQGAEVTNPTYSGVDDTTIDSALPGSNFGSQQSMTWRNNGAGQRKWTLIKFKDILDEIPDDIGDIDITTVDANIEFRLFDTGNAGRIRRAFTNFSETTTFATFAQGGGEPVEGVDYDDDDLSTINGDAAGTIDADVSEAVQLLFDGLLSGDDDELRFIVLPADNDGADETGVRTSEFTTPGDRPTLRITYSRFNIGGGLACYPDFFVNNVADTTTADRCDWGLHAGGMGVVINSENRDSDPFFTPPAPRLDTTSIALEVVGQQAGIPVLNCKPFDLSGVASRAQDPSELGRTRGFRFMSGWYDYDDALQLNQGPREDLTGASVGAIGDLNQDGVPEFVFSSPRNELYQDELRSTFGDVATQLISTIFTGSITILTGNDYSAAEWREVDDGAAVMPSLDGQNSPPFGSCTAPVQGRHPWNPLDIFQIFAEDITDFLGGARSAGDFNQDGLGDILCGAPLNNRTGIPDTGAAYVIYGRSVTGDFDLKNADDPILRAPMLRIRGARRGDEIGWRQATGLDVNGDRLDDVFIASPHTDFRNITRSTCAGDFNGDGTTDASDLTATVFNSCRTERGEDLFSNDACKVFDYDYDGDVDEDDRCVFCCLSASCEPADSCVFGTNSNDCCGGLVNNGFVGVIFGGVFIDGDRDINQIATSDLPGVIFHGSAAGVRAGYDVSSAGDFNKDGFGDIIISAPGETRVDSAGRPRLGVVYLVFGGTHLTNSIWNLNSVGSDDLPGMVLLSPYVKGRPNEAAPTAVAVIGDINNDGFDDVAIGNPLADFIDLNFPQGPDATDADLGRRRNAGDAYIVYGNNFGTNRLRD